MKKKWQPPKDIALLLGMLLVFSGIIGLINGNNVQKEKTIAPALIKNLTLEQLYDYILPLIISKSVEAIAQTVQYATFDKKLAITKKVISNEEGSLDRNDKLEFLYAVIMHHIDDKENQDALFDLLLEEKHKHLLEGAPLLYIAASTLYDKTIPHLLKWHKIQIKWHKIQMEKKVKTSAIPSAIRYMEQHAINATVDENNLEALKRMVEHGVGIDKNIANDLLWEVIAKKTDPGFISYLKTLGADMNYSQDGTRTVLHFAIEQESPQLVKKLLQEDADPNKILSKEVGPPLQQVLAQTAANNKLKKDNTTNVEINLLLREFGARR